MPLAATNYLSVLNQGFIINHRLGQRSQSLAVSSRLFHNPGLEGLVALIEGWKPENSIRTPYCCKGPNAQVIPSPMPKFGHES